MLIMCFWAAKWGEIAQKKGNKGYVSAGASVSVFQIKATEIVGDRDDRWTNLHMGWGGGAWVCARACVQEFVDFLKFFLF